MVRASSETAVFSGIIVTSFVAAAAIAWKVMPAGKKD
jgi:hypothetical protein